MKEIVIVGGGTAGWMAAIAISGRFPEKRITVVDPKGGSPIGVGESVTGVVLQFVSDPLHGLSMGEFFRRCDPTFKTGIWYKDWHGPGTEYVSPIDAPPQYFKHSYPSFTEEFYARIVADGATIGEVQLYGMLMRRNLTDYCRNPDGSVNADWAFASCQFDALKFAGWLREVAVLRPNVTHVDGIVEGFERDAENGHITSIRTQTGQEIRGEFFIDCTGFHRLLFARAYQPAWKSYAPWIKVDSALPRFVEYAPGQPIPNFTLARAMPHGWMWEIPTQSRLGRGYIFSSRYVSDEQAIADFRATGVDVGDSPRILRFEPGRFEKMWEGNVCTIGFRACFPNRSRRPPSTGCMCKFGCSPSSCCRFARANPLRPWPRNITSSSRRPMTTTSISSATITAPGARTRSSGGITKSPKHSLPRTRRGRKNGGMPFPCAKTLRRPIHSRQA